MRLGRGCASRGRSNLPLNIGSLGSQPRVCISSVIANQHGSSHPGNRNSIADTYRNCTSWQDTQGFLNLHVIFAFNIFLQPWRAYWQHWLGVVGGGQQRQRLRWRLIYRPLSPTTDISPAKPLQRRTLTNSRSS